MWWYPRWRAALLHMTAELLHAIDDRTAEIERRLTHLLRRGFDKMSDTQQEILTAVSGLNDQLDELRQTVASEAQEVRERIEELKARIPDDETSQAILAGIGSATAKIAEAIGSVENIVVPESTDDDGDDDGDGDDEEE